MEVEESMTKKRTGLVHHEMGHFNEEVHACHFSNFLKNIGSFWV